MTAWYDLPVLAGNKYQTSYLGPGTDTPHYADDVQTPFHTPLTALLSGTVVQADYAAWGGEIFIKPDNPAYPEYYFYHPDLLEVQAGQHVTAGQEIALSGGENPGYPGALHPASTAWSSGPHTHVGYFTKWITPPETGTTIPYGPDINPLINDAKAGKIPSIPASAGSTPDPTTAATGGASWSAALPDTFLKIGLVLIALLLVGAGFYALFQTQIDGAVHNGVSAAKLAVLA